MKNDLQKLQASGLDIDRRDFLTGVSVALCGLPLPALASSPVAAGKKLPKGAPRRAIHQQLVYIDNDGVGEVYDAPRGNQSTRDYLASLSQEAYLRRHWFT